MRRDIAKLLETGQEATAQIRVEHIIREEKMMAAQEIIELFCELITVRLPIIEAQKECPLDLKEAISSVCFAAPRCADLPELMQVQVSFASKYGKEFVSAATELLPECGVNRQLIELLSVRAPAPDVKLKLLKEIAEEHQLDWDPSSSESELLKTHEDLLNGPTQFVSASKLPLPKEKHDEPVYVASEQDADILSDSEAGFDPSQFPEVPKASLRPSAGTVSAPEMLPFPASALSDDESTKPLASVENLSHEHVETHQKKEEHVDDLPNSVNPPEEKQFVPFISPPVQSSAAFTAAESVPLPPSSASFTMAESTPPPSLSKVKSIANVDLQDVLAAAQAAAETAERAAAAARSAATLAQVRINELVKKKSDVSESWSENPFHSESFKSDTSDKPHLDHQMSGNLDSVLHSPRADQGHNTHLDRQVSNLPSYDDSESEVDSYLHVFRQDSAHHQPQRLPSIDDELDLPYPNLFKRQDSNVESPPFTDKTPSNHES